jgi:hypothetical protein
MRLTAFRGGGDGADVAAAVIGGGSAAFGGREVLMPPLEAPGARRSGRGGWRRRRYGVGKEKGDHGCQPMEIRLAGGSVRPGGRNGIKSAKAGEERRTKQGWSRSRVDSIGDGVAHPCQGGVALLDIRQSLRCSDGGTRLLDGFDMGLICAVHLNICTRTDGDEVHCRGRHERRSALTMRCAQVLFRA